MKQTALFLIVLLLASCAPAQPAAPSQPPATATVILPTATPTTTPEPTPTPFPAISPDLLTQAGLTGEVVYWQDETTGQWFAGSAAQDGKLMLHGGVWTPIPPGFREFLQAGGHFDGEKWVDADGKVKYTKDANGNPVDVPQEPEYPVLSFVNGKGETVTALQIDEFIPAVDYMAKNAKWYDVSQDREAVMDACYYRMEAFFRSYEDVDGRQFMRDWNQAVYPLNNHSPDGLPRPFMCVFDASFGNGTLVIYERADGTFEALLSDKYKSLDYFDLLAGDPHMYELTP